MLTFRPSATSELTGLLRAPGPAALLVWGQRSMGKTTLVREALRGRPSIWLHGSDLPSPLLAREHGARLVGEDGPDPLADDWDAVGAALLDRVGGGTFDGWALVWDRADRLLRDPRWRRMLEVVWSELRARARPVHLVLVARQPPPRDTLAFLGSPGTPVPERWLGPLTLRDVVPAMEGWSPLRQLTAFALLGGEPAVWDLVDPEVRLSTNLIRLLLEPGAPLRDFVGRRFPLPGRNPERSLALVDALARGAQEWGELRDEARVFGSSSELGPYMKGLREVGLVESRRPLDARPGGRQRRHHLVPPLLASWHALVRPWLGELDGGRSPSLVWRERLRPRLGPVVARRLPDLLATYLDHHGEERFRARAREVGGLWAEGIEIPVAGLLTNGSAVYATTSWNDPGAQAIERLSRRVAETRYGYGRESRVMVLFAALPVAWEVERSVARRDDAQLLTPVDLVGNASGSGE